MTPFAILLVTISAFAHATWNFLSKRQNAAPAIFLMASLAAVAVLSPVLFLFHRGLALMPPLAWGLLAATGTAQAIYYIALAGAYRHGDLSQAYPLARSLPVILIALVSLALGRGRQITPLAFAGFLLVAAGCLILPQQRFDDLSLEHYRHRWVWYALGAAACITAYTLLDDQALRLLRSLPGNPISNTGWSLLWVELETITLAVVLTGIVMHWKPERETLVQAGWIPWRNAALLGVMITLTYGLVLLAMAYANNVSYISAFRQLSIPIGAALGIFIRREPAGKPKLVGTAIIAAGLVMVALG
jgi:drug/metabolite transporter (DMT)-like permease